MTLIAVLLGAIVLALPVLSTSTAKLLTSVSEGEPSLPTTLDLQPTNSEKCFPSMIPLEIFDLIIKTFPAERYPIVAQGVEVVQVNCVAGRDSTRRTGRPAIDRCQSL